MNESKNYCNELIKFMQVDNDLVKLPISDSLLKKLLADEYSTHHNSLCRLLFYKTTIKAIRKGVHFNINNYDAISDENIDKYVLQNLNVPFPITVLTYHDTDVLQMKNVAILFDGDSEKAMSVLSRFHNLNTSTAAGKVVVTASYQATHMMDMWATFPVCYIINKDPGLNADPFISELTPVFEKLPYDKELGEEFPKEDVDFLSKPIAIAAINFMAMVSCTNVIKEPVYSKKELLKLNTERKNKGKKPLFESWTLRLDPTKRKMTKNDSESTVKGTPKRQHLRRGHPRHYEGYNVWISSMIVGRAENGIIEKEYLI